MHRSSLRIRSQQPFILYKLAHVTAQLALPALHQLTEPGASGSVHEGLPTALAMPTAPEGSAPAPSSDAGPAEVHAEEEGKDGTSSCASRQSALVGDGPAVGPVTDGAADASKAPHKRKRRFVGKSRKPEGAGAVARVNGGVRGLGVSACTHGRMNGWREEETNGL